MNVTLLLRTPTLGVDIGRVIIQGDGPDTSFVGGSDEQALRAPAMEGAFDALARLVDRFAGRVHLVSKCGARVEARTRVWLRHHRFFERTGVLAENVHFCRQRPDKAPICHRLGVGFFVDDRRDVLAAMTGVVPFRFLFGETTAPEKVIAAPDWAVAEREIVRVLDGVRAARGNPAALLP